MELYKHSRIYVLGHKSPDYKNNLEIKIHSFYKSIEDAEIAFEQLEQENISIFIFKCIGEHK